MEPRKRFQANVACRACWYDIPIPPRFLTPIDSLKIFSSGCFREREVWHPACVSWKCSYDVVFRNTFSNYGTPHIYWTAKCHYPLTASNKSLELGLESIQYSIYGTCFCRYTRTSTFFSSLCWNFQTIYGGYQPSRNSVVVPARQAPQSVGIGVLESILRLLKSLKFGLWVSLPSQLKRIRVHHKLAHGWLHKDSTCVQARFFGKEPKTHFP